MSPDVGHILYADVILLLPMEMLQNLQGGYDSGIKLINQDKTKCNINDSMSALLFRLL